MVEDYREFEAKTVDEAIVLAMKTFHVDFEALDIKIVSEGSKGLFGLVGTKTAKIMARPAEDKGQPGQASPGEEQENAPPPAEHADRADGHAPAREILLAAQGTLTEILSLMHMPGEVSIRHEDGSLEIAGDGSGLLIGKRGQTLDSLQFLVNRIVNKTRQDPFYITLDTEGYRLRHVNHLKALAIKMGQKAKRTGQSISLEKMNPYERRIIHLTLKDEGGVNTRSIGEGVYKKVLIVPRKASR